MEELHKSFREIRRRLSGLAETSPTLATLALSRLMQTTLWNLKREIFFKEN